MSFSVVLFQTPPVPRWSPKIQGIIACYQMKNYGSTHTNPSDNTVSQKTHTHKQYCKNRDVKQAIKNEHPNLLSIFGNLSLSCKHRPLITLVLDLCFQGSCEQTLDLISICWWRPLLLTWGWMKVAYQRRSPVTLFWNQAKSTDPIRWRNLLTSLSAL